MTHPQFDPNFQAELSALDDAIKIARFDLQYVRDEYPIDSPEEVAAFQAVEHAETRRQQFVETHTLKEVRQ